MKNILFLLLPFGLFAVSVGQTKHTVFVRDFEFNPKDINITAGDTILWQWQNGIHTTTSDATSGSDSWNAPITSSDPTFSKVITAEGLHRYYCIPHGSPGGIGMAGTITVTGTTPVNDEINKPLSFRLIQNYPNPFNPSTKIEFHVAEPSFVSLKIFNVLGTEIASLVNEFKQAGIFKISFNANELASGVYFYRMQAGNFVGVKKMILKK
jgi:plastocyanin